MIVRAASAASYFCDKNKANRKVRTNGRRLRGDFSGAVRKVAASVDAIGVFSENSLGVVYGMRE